MLMFFLHRCDTHMTKSITELESCHLETT